MRFPSRKMRWPWLGYEEKVCHQLYYVDYQQSRLASHHVGSNERYGGCTFENLFDCIDRTPLEMTIEFESLVSLELNALMRASLREELINFSLFAMPKGKALGLVSTPTDIYRYLWAVVKQDIRVVTLFFLCQCYILKSLNHTFMTLIPKR